MRALLILVDGVDEAASLRSHVEEFVHYELVPSGNRCLVTSRPEGITLVTPALRAHRHGHRHRHGHGHGHGHGHRPSIAPKHPQSILKRPQNAPKRLLRPPPLSLSPHPQPRC